MEVERARWEETHRKKQEAFLMQKERELSEQVRQGRDKEIELVISTLEADMENSRQETEKAAENRVKRVREKYESETRELEAVERNTMERYNSLKVSRVTLLKRNNGPFFKIFSGHFVMKIYLVHFQRNMQVHVALL